MARGVPVLLVGLSAGLLMLSSPRAFADSAGTASEEQRSVGSTVGFAALAGLSFPTCGWQASCEGSSEAGPSIRGVALFQPNRTWGFGLAGRLRRNRWSSSFVDATGATQGVASTVTAGLVGIAARFTVLPEQMVSPIVEATVGTGFQMESRASFGCNQGLIPTGELGLGGRVRLSSVSIFAVATASNGVQLVTCKVSDGPPVTPFVGWGFGTEFGVAIDLGLEAAGGQAPR